MKCLVIVVLYCKKPYTYVLVVCPNIIVNVFTESLPSNALASHAAAIVVWRLTTIEMCLFLRCVATSEAWRCEERLHFLLLRSY
jgi:hypothetical protein